MKNVQLQADIHCLGKQTDSYLTTTSFRVVAESTKVSPELPFLQAKQLQFP